MKRSSKLELRPVSENDLEFLYRVFVSTRPDILAATHLPEAQRAELMEMQFRAQHTHYGASFPHAQFAIIQYGNTPVGRLYVNRTNEEVHIIDISILPEYRSEGIGSTLIRALQTEAKLTNRSVRIHVLKSNHEGIKFYIQLGFMQIGEKELHFEMRWSDDSASDKIIVDIPSD